MLSIDTNRFGFVAQEVETVLPALVSTTPSGYKVLNLKDLISVLTLGLQSLERVTADLEREVAKLDGRVESDHRELTQRVSAAEEELFGELIAKLLQDEQVLANFFFAKFSLREDYP